MEPICTCASQTTLMVIDASFRRSTAVLMLGLLTLSIDFHGLKSIDVNESLAQFDLKRDQLKD